MAGRYALRAGGQLRVHVGDTVMTRRNDRRLGVLNGQRGIVTALDGDTGVLTVERRQVGPDGPELVVVDLPREYVHDGHLQLAYAITAAKAQGLTSDRALVYGNGMDAHTLYPAMSRDRHRVDLWLALEPLETDADRARHGPPGTETEARRRAVDVYAAAVANDRPDTIVLTDLGETPDPIAPRPATEPREPVVDVDALAARVEQLPDGELRQPSDHEVLRAQREAVSAAGGRAEYVPAGANLAHVPWQQRPHGKVPTDQLADAAARAEQAAERAAAAAAARERAEQERLAAARAGQEPAMRELEQQREQLQAAVDAARQAEQHLRAAQAHQATARQARAEIRAIEDAERRRSRLAKLVRPRADEVAREVRRLTDVAMRADDDAGNARAAAYPHTQLVRHTPDAAARLADLERHWPERAAAAMRADEQPPVTAAPLAARAFPRQPWRPRSSTPGRCRTGCGLASPGCTPPAVTSRPPSTPRNTC